MKKFIVIFFLLILNNSTFSQRKKNENFISLIAIDTIYKTSEKDINIENEFHFDKFYIKEWIDKTNTAQKVLFYLKENKFIIFSLPNDDGNFSFFQLSDNNKYITYSTYYGFGGRNHAESKSHFHIIDLRNLKYISLNSQLITEDWEEDKQAEISECNCEFILKNNILSVKTKKTENKKYKYIYEEDCIPTGTYIINNNILKRIKSSH